MINYKNILSELKLALESTDAKTKSIHWQRVENLFPYSTEMKECIQDSVYHAEGDVWTHIRMIAQHVHDRGHSNDVQLLTTLFHDVAKAKTREEIVQPDRIRISHPYHSRISAQMAWVDMWQHNIGDIATRLQVYKQIQWHQRSYHIWKNTDMVRSALTYSIDAPWHDLIEFSICDNLGRISAHQQETVESLELLRMWLEEHNISNKQWHSNSSKIFYFEKEGRDHTYHAQRPKGSNVIIMCGLPGSGKDTYVAENFCGLPVISMDQIRIALKIDHGDNQGPVIQTALETAKEYLRKKSPFVWNSTNLTRLARGKVIDLCRAYDAYTNIYIMGTDFQTTLAGNKSRKAVVPESVIYSMLNKWEPVSRIEAHEVNWIVR